MPKTITIEFMVPDEVSTTEALEIMHENFCGFRPYVDSQVVVSQQPDHLDETATLTVFTNELDGTEFSEAMERTIQVFTKVLNHINKAKTIEK